MEEEPTEKRSRMFETPSFWSDTEPDSDDEYLERLINSNSYLTYDILRIVFRYLNGRDLGNAAMVSRLWSEAANSEKSTRSPHCFMIKDFNLDCVNESRVKSSVAFFFIPDGMPLSVQEYLMNLLPSNCEAIILYTGGIIINNREMQCDAIPNIVCALFPKVPNVNINIFRVTHPLKSYSSEEYTQTYKYQSKELTKLLDNIPNDDKSCLMLFCNSSGYKIASLMALCMRRKKDKVASLWGGVVEKIHTHSDNDDPRQYDNPYCLVVSITGPIQSWSIVIDRKCKKKEQVEEKLTLFKSQIKLKKHSVGFIFACRARGCVLHGEGSMESTIFKRLFPKVPLVGCFGDGEFGKNTIPVNEDNTMANYTSSKKWYNEFSTIFMILTYG